MNLGGQRCGLQRTFIGCLLSTHHPFFSFLVLSRFSFEELPLHHCVAAIQNGVGCFGTIQIILPAPPFGIVIGSGNSDPEPFSVVVSSLALR